MAAKTRVGLGTETQQDNPGIGDTLFVGSHPQASASGVGTAEAEAGEPVRGDSIGRFVVLGVLGAGGMGLVYSGYDPNLDRKVAIKLLRGAAVRADAGDASTRLLREAQAMAKINHPNVIKVHEVGLFGEQVYVAMEFADAGTVRAWLAAEPRDRREIIEVFVQAGRGLAAAHSVGLVHRDFKPDNVMMSKDGNVRVTDFGLVSTLADDSPPAEATKPDSDLYITLSGSTPLSQNLTRTGAIMGTPTYMAPEQFGGGSAGARSDQFSYCVALYEALYGERPFQGATYQELATNVLIGAVKPPPSTARVPGWVRRIVLRGLSVDPAARYPSMLELLAALVLDPVRRKRRMIAGGAVLAIATLGVVLALRPAAGGECRAGSARVAGAWNPARRATMKAAFERSARPHAVATFGKVTDKLDAWSRAWEAGYVDACEDTRIRGDQSEHLLDLRNACLTRHLDDARATIELLAVGGGDAVDHALEAVVGLPSLEACADAAALLAEVAPPSATAKAPVAAVRAQLDVARGHLRLARYAKALEIAKAALVAARATGYRPVAAEALVVVGQLDVSLGDLASIEVFREAMHAYAESGDSADMIEAATWLVFALTTQAGRYELAQEIGSLAEATAAHAHPSTEIVVRLDNALGLLEATRGHPAEARVRYETALAIAQKAFGPDHPAVLTTINQLGNLAKTEGRFADAAKLLQRVVASRERAVGSDHPEFASAISNLANVYRVEGKLDEAKRLYDRALAIRLVAFGPEHPEVAASLTNLGTLYSEQEDHATALGYFEKALAVYEKVLAPNHIDIAGALQNLASAMEGAGDYDHARAANERALAIFEAAHGPDHPSVASVLSNLGVVAQNQHKFDEAMAFFQRALKIAETSYGPDHPEVADYLANIATVYKQQHKLDDAQRAMTRALRVTEKAYGADHSRMGMLLSNIGNLQYEREDYLGALDSYKKSLAIFEVKLGAEHPHLSYSLFGIGVSLTELKRYREAIPFLERAVAIRTAAKMSPDSVAEVEFSLAEALVADPHTRKRARGLVTAVLATYVKEKNTAGAAEIRKWLAAHR